MSDFKGLYSIRDSVPDDKNFIMATFLKGLYYGDSWFSIIPKQIFMTNYKLIAEKILASPFVSVKIACLPDDPSVIIGYSILSADMRTVHWVYCKNAWRRKGIGKSLVPEQPQAVTHLSTLGKIILDKNYKQTTFNPFDLR